MDAAPISNSVRSLRACMVCAVVMTTNAFISNGCPNCEFLDLKGNADGVAECTSSAFEGTIALNKPQESWVAKWQRVDKYVPGVYAIKVVGTLNQERIDDAEEAGIIYFPRDGTSADEQAQQQGDDE